MAKNAGLWANIHAKRKRIKAGSGERMRRPGEEGAPTAKALKDSQTKKKKKAQRCDRNTVIARYIKS